MNVPALTYDRFKAQWNAALQAVGLLSPYDHPVETIDLRHMDRMYSVSLGLAGPQLAEPFTVTGVLSWRWDALQAARTSTTEEDLLIELHGRHDAAEMQTACPWLRVDVKLRAELPWGRPHPLPTAATWKAWVGAVTEDVAPLFPMSEASFNDGTVVLGGCDQPRGKIQCEPDGRVLLTGVVLEAWQPIMLARAWDNPDRQPDAGADNQLAALAGRFRDALRRWGECARRLRVHSEQR